MTGPPRGKVLATLQHAAKTFMAEGNACITSGLEELETWRCHCALRMRLRVRWWIIQ